METSSYFLINDCPEGYYSWPGRVLLTSSTQPRIIKKTAPKDTTHNLGPALKNIIFLRDYFRDFFLAGLRAGSNHNFLIIPESDGIFLFPQNWLNILCLRKSLTDIQFVILGDVLTVAEILQFGRMTNTFANQSGILIMIFPPGTFNHDFLDRCLQCQSCV